MLESCTFLASAARRRNALRERGGGAGRSKNCRRASGRRCRRRDHPPGLQIETYPLSCPLRLAPGPLSFQPRSGIDGGGFDKQNLSLNISNSGRKCRIAREKRDNRQRDTHLLLACLQPSRAQLCSGPAFRKELCLHFPCWALLDCKPETCSIRCTANLACCHRALTPAVPTSLVRLPTPDWTARADPQNLRSALFPSCYA